MRSSTTISPFAGAAVIPRLAVLVLIVLILGVPINDFWRFLLLTMAVMAVCFGRVQLEPLRWLAALAIVLTVIVVDWLLPARVSKRGTTSIFPSAPVSLCSRESCRRTPNAPCGRFSSEPIYEPI
jgi:hypothetical protein